MEENYRVILTGEWVPGSDPVEVGRRLAELLNIDPEKAARLFPGKRVVIKDNMDLESSRWYAVRFEEKSGARCSIEKKGVDEKDPVPDQRDGRTAEVKARAGGNENDAESRDARFNLFFNGEIKNGTDIREVKSRLIDLLKINAEKIELFFTGSPVRITGPVDFWKASHYMRKFSECGAVCRLETVMPVTGAAGSHKPGETPVNAPESLPEVPQGAEAHGAADISTRSGKLYDLLDQTYQGICSDYRIEKKSREFEKTETAWGCLFIIIMLAALVLVIWSPLPWYWGLIGTVVILGVLASLMRSWDTAYAEAFLKRMDSEKKKDPALFAATLNKWAQDLPAADRGRGFFLNTVEKILEEHPGLEAAFKKNCQILGADPDTVFSSVPVTVKNQAGGKNTGGKNVKCPRCGSQNIMKDIQKMNWGKGVAATMFFGPLAGYMVGSMSAGNQIYRCRDCGKKFPRRKK